VSASEGDKNIVLAFKKDALDDYTLRQNLNILFEYLHINIILPCTMPTRRLDLVLFFGNKWSQMVSNPR